jgi:hypothetical protein
VSILFYLNVQIALPFSSPREGDISIYRPDVKNTLGQIRRRAGRWSSERVSLSFAFIEQRSQVKEESPKYQQVSRPDTASLTESGCLPETNGLPIPGGLRGRLLKRHLLFPHLSERPGRLRGRVRQTDGLTGLNFSAGGAGVMPAMIPQKGI